MKLVGAGAHDGVHDRAAHAAILRRVVAGDDFELQNRIRRGLGHLIRKTLIAGGIGIVVHAVQQEVVVSAPHAVGVEGAFARWNRVGVNGAVDVHGEQGQVGVIAAVQGQLDDRRRADHLPAVARVRFENRRGAAHVHGLGDRAHLQRKVYALARAHHNGHVAARYFLEPGGLHFHHVSPHLHIEEVVISVFIGGGAGRNARILIRQRNACLRDDASGRVPHRAQDLGVFKLRQERRRGAQKDGEKRTREADPADRYSDCAADGRGRTLAGQSYEMRCWHRVTKVSSPVFQLDDKSLKLP